MRSKVKINVIFSLLCQVITILYGLIVPRLILQSFGSEVNGLVSSISQFLNYITLLEGGVTGVIMAALYKPLNNKDNLKISAIIKATNTFFKRIALIFVIYSLAVAFIYPTAIETTFSWGFISSLTLIIALTLFIQYFFSLTYRLLIVADQKGYIVYIVQIICTVTNFIFTLVVLKCYPQIHILKIANVITYVIQPTVYNLYVKKHYGLNLDVDPDKNALSQRWDGFGQNLAFFIHTNTDVVVITLFSSLINVSIYSVFFMVAGSLKNLVTSISSAVVPALGSVAVGNDIKEKNKVFDYYEFGISFVTVFAFSCGCLLINPFIKIYTAGIADANYNQPVFGVLLMLAEAIYCLRDPYVSMAYVSGHFKQTAKYAYVEATMNIVVSVLLVKHFGLIGVAIGTLVSMFYRMIMHVYYLKINLIQRPIRKSSKNIAISCFLLISCSAIGLFLAPFFNGGVTTWIAWAIVIVFCVLTIMCGIHYVVNNDLFLKMIYRILKRNTN